MSKTNQSKTYKATVTSEAFSAHEASARQAPATPEEIDAVARGIDPTFGGEYTGSDGKVYRDEITFEVVDETLVGTLRVVSVMTGKPVAIVKADTGSTASKFHSTFSAFRVLLRKVDAALAARPVDAPVEVRGASAVTDAEVIAHLKDAIETGISDLTEIDAERGLAMDARYSEAVEASTDAGYLSEVNNLVQDEYLIAAFTPEEEEGVA